MVENLYLYVLTNALFFFLFEKNFFKHPQKKISRDKPIKILKKVFLGIKKF